MAKRAAKPKPEPEPETYDDEDDEAEEESVSAESEDGAAGNEAGEEEYVLCPVCRGRNKSCTYCEGFGDVHPDDVDAILEAHRKAGGVPTAVIIIAVCLILGLGAAGFMIVRSNQNNTEDGGAGASGTGAQSNTQSGGAAGPLPPPAPTLRNQDATDAIIDMKIYMKAKTPAGYQKAIEIGEAALPKAQDPTQRKNLEDLLAQARAKLNK